MKRDQKKFLDAIQTLFKDNQRVEIDVSKADLWCLLSAVQLACRHPKFNGPTREAAEKIARQIGGTIVANNADLRMLFEMGWQQQFDESSDS